MGCSMANVSLDEIRRQSDKAFRIGKEIARRHHQFRSYGDTVQEMTISDACRVSQQNRLDDDPQHAQFILSAYYAEIKALNS